MSRRQRLLSRIVERWIRRFGEPPPIRTDPQLMERILAEAEARDVSDAPRRDAA